MLNIARYPFLEYFPIVLGFSFWQNELIPPLNLRNGVNLLYKSRIFYENSFTTILSILVSFYFLLFQLAKYLSFSHLFTLLYIGSTLRKT